MKTTRLIFVAILSLLSIAATAQQKTGNVTGRVMLQPDASSNQHRMEGAIGAAVQVQTATDTLSTSVGSGGVFAVRKVPLGRATVRFTMLGYKERIDTVEVKQGETQLWAMLEVQAEEIESVVVKGKPNPLSVRGDTLIYHAAAVSTLKGDEAISILEQMPGVTVGDNSVTVLDKTVSKVYIDGRLMFGNDPMTALNNLSASEVINIKTYDEYSNKDPRHHRRETDDKERVLDIETKSKLQIAYVGNLLAGLGSDMGESARTSKLRYSAGADVNLFSEKLQSSINVNANNIGRSSNRRRNMLRDFSGSGGYNRTVSAAADVSKKWLSETANFPKASIDASYSYNNSFGQTASIAQQVYFPSEDYLSREYSDTTSNSSRSNAHNLNLGFSKSLKDGWVSLNHTMSTNNNNGDNYSASFDNVVNNENISSWVGTRKESQSRSSGWSLSDNLNYNQLFANKFGVGAQGSFSFSDNDGSGESVDSLASTAAQIVLTNNSTSISRNYSGSVSTSYQFSQRSSLNLAYSLSRNYSSADKRTLDITNPYESLTDTTNTYHYTRDNTTQSLSLFYGDYFASVEGVLAVGVKLQSTRINRNETFPGLYDYNHTFNAILPSVMFGTNKMINNVNVNYSTSTNVPSIEQLRPQINNSNLYSLTVGNPNLKQSYTHSLELKYSTVVGKEATSTFGLGLRGSLTSDVIASKRIYFTSPTDIQDVVPYVDYNYTIPAQATLTTYENVADSHSLSGSVSFDTPLNFIKSNFTSSVSMSYSDSPAYVQDELNRTNSYRPSVKVGLRSNFSRKIQISINSTSAYNYSRNTVGNDNKIFNESVNLNWSFNDIFGFLYTAGNYSATFYRNLSMGSASDVNTNILNLSGGVRFGKNNNLDLSFNIYDVLNRDPGYSTSMQSNYVQNRWTQQFGRYFIVNLSYKFNSTHSGGADFMGGRSRGGFRGGNRGGNYDAPPMQMMTMPAGTRIRM